MTAAKRRSGKAAESRGAQGGGVGPREGRGAVRRSGGADGGRGARYLPFLLYAAATLILFREFVFSDDMLLGIDTLGLGYVARDFFAAALERGVFPLWNPLILGGTPFLDSLAGGDSLYPPSLFLLVAMDTHRALGWKLVLHIFLAGAFMHLWLRSLGVARGATTVASLGYLLAPFMVSLVYPGHDGKIFVTALTPLLFWVTEGTIRDRGLLPFVGVSLVVALVILTTHFQMAYFLFGAVGIYAVIRLGLRWWEDRREVGDERDVDGSAAARGRPGGALSSPVARLAGFLLASVLGAGVAAVQLVPAVEYVTESSRRTATTVRAEEAGGVEYSSSWSLHPEEIVSLVVPEFAGANVGEEGWSANTYWGRNPVKLNSEYGGVVILLLAGLAFFATERRRIRWILSGVGGVALLYALGAHTPVWRIFYEVVPGVRLFRAPSISIFLFGFAAATLAGLGLDWAVRTAERPAEGRAETRSGWRGASAWLWGATGALALGTLLAASGALLSAWQGILYREIGAQATSALANAEPFIVRGFFLATVLVAATAGLLWALRRGLLGRTWVLAGLGLLVALDLFRVDAPFLETVDFHAWAAPDENVRFLVDRQEEEPPFRVLSFLRGGQDVEPSMYGLELAGGHHPNDLARYRELIGMRGSGLPVNLLHPNVYRILNVRYLVWPEYQQGPLEGLSRVSAVRLPDGRVVESVYRLRDLPRARLVAEARVVAEEQAVDTILSDDYDPTMETVLDREPPIALGGGAVEGGVEWLERETNRQVLRVRADRPSLLVLADNWYPAWHATVDGEEVEVLRADHTLRAVALPGGEHRVELEYRSTLLGASLGTSVLSLLVVLAVGAFDVVRRRRAGRGPLDSREGGEA